MRRKIINAFSFFIFIFALLSCNSNDNSNNEQDKNDTIPPINDSNNDEVTPKELILEDLKYEGYNERIFLSFKKEGNYNYNIALKEVSQDEYTNIENEFINDNGITITCDINNIPAGTYDIYISRMIVYNRLEKFIKNIEVSSLDRSGYAHFQCADGIGAYNNDGTIKDNTIILDLTNENKNTIEAIFSNNSYKGIVNILKNLSKSTQPVLIRVHGKITTNQWNYKEVISRLIDDSNLIDDHFENTFSSEYGENIENLELKCFDKKEGKAYRYVTTKDGIIRKSDSTTSKATINYKGAMVYHDDSYFNCAAAPNAKNVTIEGVGLDAELFQWGISFSNSDSIEIKNLTFTDYPEDAIGFSSSDDDVSKHGRYWIHNNVFNRGKNNWDLTGEQDKYAGDGALDFQNISNATASYNRFINCKKTGLVSSNDTSKCKNITFHHNYYKDIEARLPLARGANIHIYNNYYDSCISCLNIKYNSYVLSEENYFFKSNGCHVVTKATIKSYNDIFVSSTAVQSIRVNSRDESVANNCNYNGIDYSSFDTNPELFYYDEINKKSDVSIYNDAKEVKLFLDKYCGLSILTNQLPLTKNKKLNDKIYSKILSDSTYGNINDLIYDITSIENDTSISKGGFIQLGDFKVYYGFEFSGSNCLLKNLGSDFEKKTGLIEFYNKLDDEINIDFSSRNQDATNRYLIIYDENGEIISKSECANGINMMTHTIKLEANKKYYIGSYQGIIIYGIY